MDSVAFSIWLLAAVLFAVFMFLLLMVLCFGIMVRLIYRFIRE